VVAAVPATVTSIPRRQSGGPDQGPLPPAPARPQGVVATGQKAVRAPLRCAKLVGMTVTLHVPEDLVNRLEAEAVRRGMSVDELSAQLLAAGLPEKDALEAFIGCGSSGKHEPFDIHAARSELAGRKLAKGA
jgi:hypothetical protein